MSPCLKAASAVVAGAAGGGARPENGVPEPPLSTKQAKIVFTPSGRRGRFAHGTPAAGCGAQPGRRCGFGVWRPRHMRALPGDLRRGRVFPSMPSPRGRIIFPPPGEVEHRYGERKAAAGPGPPLELPGADRGRFAHRRAAGKPDAPAGGAQGGRASQHHAGYFGAPVLRRGAGGCTARSVRRFEAPVRCPRK